MALEITARVLSRGRRVVVLSSERNERAMMIRLGAVATRVPPESLRAPGREATLEAYRASVAGRLCFGEFSLDDKADRLAVLLGETVAIMRPALVVVDSIPGKSRARAFIRRVDDAAVVAGVPVLATLRIGRAPKRRPAPHEPRLDDVPGIAVARERGVPVILVHRPNYYTPEGDQSLLEAIVLRGRSARVSLRWLTHGTGIDGGKG